MWRSIRASVARIPALWGRQTLQTGSDTRKQPANALVTNAQVARGVRSPRIDIRDRRQDDKTLLGASSRTGPVRAASCRWDMKAERPQTITQRLQIRDEMAGIAEQGRPVVIRKNIVHCTLRIARRLEREKWQHVGKIPPGYFTILLKVLLRSSLIISPSTRDLAKTSAFTASYYDIYVHHHGPLVERFVFLPLQVRLGLYDLIHTHYEVRCCSVVCPDLFRACMTALQMSKRRVHSVQRSQHFSSSHATAASRLTFCHTLAHLASPAVVLSHNAVELRRSEG